MIRPTIVKSSPSDHASDGHGHCCAPVTSERCCENWHYPVIVHFPVSCQPEEATNDACACAATVEEPDIAALNV